MSAMIPLLPVPPVSRRLLEPSYLGARAAGAPLPRTGFDPNYEQQRESKISLPNIPSSSKPATVIAGPDDDMSSLPCRSREERLNYGCCSCHWQRGANLAEPKVLEYVLGYAAANGVPLHDWQLNPPGGQWGGDWAKDSTAGRHFCFQVILSSAERRLT